MELSPCPAGGGVDHPPPLRFFEDSENGDAKRRRFLHTLSVINFAPFLENLFPVSVNEYNEFKYLC